MDDRFTADQWKQALGLLTHPEGGFYRQTYRSGEEVDTGGLPSHFAGSRYLEHWGIIEQLTRPDSA